MMERKKSDLRFMKIPIIEIIDETNSRRILKSSSTEQVIESQKQTSNSVHKILKRSSYTPPDSLMYPLFNAIQRKSWIQAKKLCHQLIVCDPEKPSYYELYLRLEQITNLINQRFHPQSARSQTTTNNSDK